MSDLRLSPIRSLMNNELFRSAFKLAVLTAGTYYATKFIIYLHEHSKPVDPKVRAVLEKLDVKEPLNKYELTIAANLVDPENLSVTWEDIAGMNDIRHQIFTEVIIPLRSKKICKGSYLFQPTKGGNNCK